MTTADRAVAPYLDAFAAQKATLPGARAEREAAIARFAAQGFPTLRDEAWKYTNLSRHLRNAFVGVGASRIADFSLKDHGVDGPRYRLVFVNGAFAPELSDVGARPKGAVAHTIGEALRQGSETLGTAPSEDGLAALNTALTRDGLRLKVGRGVALDQPIDLVHVVSGEGATVGSHPRNVVVLEPESDAMVVETYVGFGAASYWTNAVTDIVVGRNARLRHARIQTEALAGLHVGRVRARLDAAATYAATFLSTGANLARNEIAVALAGEGASCSLRGGTLVCARQHGDITTDIEHLRPHGESRQLFKSVVADEARSVYQGRIIVRREAQKTDARQTSRNLLLSRTGQADTKPELRIFADDVKCSHGATVGELDRDALFYLRSRGVPESAARALLVDAFIDEILEDAPDVFAVPLRRTIASWLASSGQAKEAT